MSPQQTQMRRLPGTPRARLLYRTHLPQIRSSVTQGSHSRNCLKTITVHPNTADLLLSEENPRQNSHPRRCGAGRLALDAYRKQIYGFTTESNFTFPSL